MEHAAISDHSQSHSPRADHDKTVGLFLVTWRPCRAQRLSGFSKRSGVGSVQSAVLRWGKSRTRTTFPLPMLPSVVLCTPKSPYQLRLFGAVAEGSVSFLTLGGQLSERKNRDFYSTGSGVSERL